MSKRCKLQKEYYKEFGNYKGSGKYTDHYVNWLESKVLAINYTRCCTVENEQLRFLIDKFQTPKGNYLIELLMAEKERKDKKP